MTFYFKKKSKKIAFFQFFQIKMVLFWGLRVDRGNEVWNFEGNFINFEDYWKILISLL